MIAIDSSELRSTSTMPDIPGACVVDHLEDLCGADVLISSIDLPCGKLALIQEHIDNKAVLIQLKRGSDLASSIADRRLNFCLAKMNQLTPNSFQRWLITTGILTNRDGDDTAYFDGVPLAKLVEGLSHIGYRACQTAIRHWQMRCGRYLNVARLSDLPQQLKDFERDLIAMQNNPALDMYPDAPKLEEDTDDPFQVIRRINDWRVPASWLIGPKKTQAIFDAVHGHGGLAYKYLSDLRLKDLLPKGVYESDQRKFRQRMCLADDEIIEVRKLTTDDY